MKPLLQIQAYREVLKLLDEDLQRALVQGIPPGMRLSLACEQGSTGSMQGKQHERCLLALKATFIIHI